MKTEEIIKYLDKLIENARMQSTVARFMHKKNEMRVQNRIEDTLLSIKTDILKMDHFANEKETPEKCIYVTLSEGPKPRSILEEERLEHIKQATYRYLERNLDIPNEWIKQYNELVERINR